MVFDERALLIRLIQLSKIDVSEFNDQARQQVEDDALQHAGGFGLLVECGQCADQLLVNGYRELGRILNVEEKGIGDGFCEPATDAPGVWDLDDITGES